MVIGGSIRQPKAVIGPLMQPSAAKWVFNLAKLVDVGQPEAATAGYFSCNHPPSATRMAPEGCYTSGWRVKITESDPSGDVI